LTGHNVCNALSLADLATTHTDMKACFPLLRLTGLAAAVVIGLGALTQDVTAAAAPGPQNVKAKVVDVKGQANVKVGDELGAGSVVTTGPGSTVILDLGVGGRVSVREDSTLSIDKLTVQGGEVGETKMEVRKGSIMGDVKKLGAASKYEVATAKGVAGIRGTRYHIFAIGIFRCAEGQLVVRILNITTGQQQNFTVAPGQGLDNTTGVPAPVAAIANALVQIIHDVFETTGGGPQAVVVFVRVPTETFVSPTTGGRTDNGHSHPD
jgi:hypothetical protein